MKLLLSRLEAERAHDFAQLFGGDHACMCELGCDYKAELVPSPSLSCLKLSESETFVLELKETHEYGKCMLVVLQLLG